MKQFVISELEASPEVDSITKLELAWRYDIKPWRAAACLALAMRDSPLSVEEARRLGVDFSAKLAQAREGYYRMKYIKMADDKLVQPTYRCNICSEMHYNSDSWASRPSVLKLPLLRCSKCNLGESRNISLMQDKVRKIVGRQDLLLEDVMRRAISEIFSFDEEQTQC